MPNACAIVGSNKYMEESVRTITPEQYETTIAERLTPGAALEKPAVYHLGVGRNKACIRQTGAYVTNVTLAKGRDAAVPILYGPTTVEELLPVKLNASHAMMQMTYGDQHGPARNIDYEYVRGHDGRKMADVHLHSVAPAEGLQITRYFKLEPGLFQIKTGLANPRRVAKPGSQPPRQRLGEHLYFNLPGGNAEGLQLIAKDGSNPLSDPDVLQKAMRGESQYWSDPAGALEVIFPDSTTGSGKHLSVVAEAQLFDIEGTVSTPGEQGWLLWRRQNTDSICIEPVWGYGEHGVITDAKGFSLPIGSMAMLTTTIELL